MLSSERKQTSNMGQTVKCSLLHSSTDTGASFLCEAEKTNREQISQSMPTAGNNWLHHWKQVYSMLSVASPMLT